VDFLGWTLRWSSSCGSLPPSRDQSHSLQIQLRDEDCDEWVKEPNEAKFMV